MSNFNARAINVLLAPGLNKAQRAARLGRMAQQAEIAMGNRCPEDDCRSTDTEDNGCRGRDLIFRCCDCGEEWGPGADL